MVKLGAFRCDPNLNKPKFQVCGPEQGKLRFTVTAEMSAVGAVPEVAEHPVVLLVGSPPPVAMAIKCSLSPRGHQCSELLTNLYSQNGDTETS
jgi:hypothetical protein